MAAFIAIVIIVVVLLVALNYTQQREAKERNRQALELIPDFDATVSFSGGKGSDGIALDPQSQKFAISIQGQPAKVYNFSQLVAVEVMKNGSSITKTNRGSQVAGAAIGAMLLGPAGLLLGGLSGSKSNVEKIGRLSLKIYTNDLITPVTEVTFFHSTTPVSPKMLDAGPYPKELDEWYGRFRTILHMRENAQSA